MRKNKIMVIFGTRPEAIKMAPVIAELHNHSEDFIPVVCVTAQHREMLDQVLAVFEIIPDYDLNIMKAGQNLSHITKTAIAGLDGIIEKERPDVVLVQGDTTTTFCGALAAFYRGVKVGHVEAGLRTNDKYAPFPEEINRRLTTQLTDYHFAPTEHAKKSLLYEGIDGKSIYVTGNTVIDSLLLVREKVRVTTPDLPIELTRNKLNEKQIILVTGHRRESFGEGFENICQAIRDVADEFTDICFVYPVHLNPNVREPVNRILGQHNRVILIEPLPYASFVWLMDRASIILTDSGGVQEEAPSLGKPVLVMRETTERPEGVETGNVLLVGVQREKIVNGLHNLLNNAKKRELMAKAHNPYGDGKASERIVDIIRKELGGH